jgi:hypothetical protein
MRISAVDFEPVKLVGSVDTVCFGSAGSRAAGFGDDDEVLVVPKLEAVGGTPALAAEVEHELEARSLEIQWVQRPAAVH